MKIQIGNKGNAEIIIVDNTQNLRGSAKDFDSLLLDSRRFKKDYLEVYSHVSPEGKGYILVGLGTPEELVPNDYAKAAFKAAQELKRHKIDSAVLELPSSSFSFEKIFSKIAEGLYQSDYLFDRYKSKKEEKFSPEVSIPVENSLKESASSILTATENLVKGIFITRDLVNTPPIDLYPQVLAEKAKDLLEPLGIDVEVLDKKQIEALGMHAFLSVAKGSEKEPRFIIMKYLPLGEDVPALTYVGKGLTYDSGGYSIKPRMGMITMKCDMAGSASVIGALYALAKNKIQRNVIGVVAACENLISGGAYKNGDIISTMKGTTIEVRNTDAEGRLTLADALYYAATQLNSSAIIDLATLTGDCVRAFGQYTAGVVSNDDSLFDALSRSADSGGEYLTRFPVVRELRELIKSDIADLRNATEQPGGAITAGLFLESFVEGTPWCHMDIAGVAWTDKAYSYIPVYGTGVPVKTLYHLAAEEASDF